MKLPSKRLYSDMENLIANSEMGCYDTIRFAAVRREEEGKVSLASSGDGKESIQKIPQGESITQEVTREILQGASITQDATQETPQRASITQETSQEAPITQEITQETLQDSLITQEIRKDDEIAQEIEITAKIKHIMSEDPGISLKEVAIRLNVKFDSVRYRVKQMKKKR
ncbi:MAG: hypothetical protein LUI87_06270 [Lachnospiraceae bacterium]|nr:hypothetical protein [Lachnospiraceae bacterium]